MLLPFPTTCLWRKINHIKLRLEVLFRSRLVLGAADLYKGRYRKVTGSPVRSISASLNQPRDTGLRGGLAPDMCMCMGHIKLAQTFAQQLWRV